MNIFLKRIFCLDILFVSFLLLNPLQSLASSATGEILFTAQGKPSFLSIEGKGAKLEGDVKNEKGFFSGAFKVDLQKFDTGIKLRNKHMLEKYLEIGKQDFRYARFVLTPTFLEAEKESTFKGKLYLHGVEKEVAGKVLLENRKGKSIGQVTFPINIIDFNIEVPSYAGITVKNDVIVNLNVETDL